MNFEKERELEMVCVVQISTEIAGLKQTWSFDF